VDGGKWIKEGGRAVDGGKWIKEGGRLGWG
jgi:hypothetical protein